MLYTILEGHHPRIISAKFGWYWLSSFRGEDLNVIFYQNMPNLHNWYLSVERKNSQKNPEYMLNYSFPYSCSKNLRSFRFIIKQQWTIEEISIFSNSSHLEWRAEHVGHNFEMGPPHPNLVQRFQRKRLKCDLYQNMPNLHNRYKSAERKSSQKNPEYMKLFLAM